ncbi:GNAT family N-acetyltransferase [Roseateles sp. BYS180W]|uniref:GNAT family N-acetyltransferase n=1 Tax=Roseateles rivi TaxID=3299028 RepID=A0ABW7FTV0_9BURK
MIHLVPLAESDLDELLTFEITQRAFFESRINARAASYYSRDGLAQALAEAAADAAADRAYQFLMRDADGVLVGRINLTGVRRQHFYSAEVGYRVAEFANGKGYAKAALGQLLVLAFGALELKRLEAKASVGNPGSARVLQAHGFVPFGRSHRSFELGGVWHDCLHFERHAQPG